MSTAPSAGANRRPLKVLGPQAMGKVISIPERIICLKACQADANYRYFTAGSGRTALSRRKYNQIYPNRAVMVAFWTDSEGVQVE